ncbi:hypothetical protein BU26DRAFT_608163, partial [Trematosphaeria pertusa]
MSHNCIAVVLIIQIICPLVSGDQASTTSDKDDRLAWYSASSDRSTVEILWTCLFTIFLCCWTAIHPDIPPPGSSWKQQWLDRTICLFIGAIAPEVFIYIALMERFVARKRFEGPMKGLAEDK